VSTPQITGKQCYTSNTGVILHRITRTILHCTTSI
jgi:hypothetical protein